MPAEPMNIFTAVGSSTAVAAAVCIGFGFSERTTSEDGGVAPPRSRSAGCVPGAESDEAAAQAEAHERVVHCLARTWRTFVVDCLHLSISAGHVYVCMGMLVVVGGAAMCVSVVVCVTSAIRMVGAVDAGDMHMPRRAILVAEDCGHRSAWRRATLERGREKP